MIGISTEVKSRISKYYGRQSNIIFPPVNVEQFITLGKRNTSRKDYYLVVGRLVKYKKVDLVVKTFNKLNKKLVIVGTGREEKALKKIAKKNIKFISNVSDSELSKLYLEAKALIFPQCEDFGLVVVEALASGTPIIAYKKGGALDTVDEGITGVFFKRQTTQSLLNAVKKFETLVFSKNVLQTHAKTFSKVRFLSEFATMLRNI